MWLSVHCFRKMTKHICILIPLFGVPYIIFTVMSIMLDVAYLYAEMFFSSFQVNWLSVSLVFNTINVYSNTWKLRTRFCVLQYREIGRELSSVLDIINRGMSNARCRHCNVGQHLVNIAMLIDIKSTSCLHHTS